MYPEHLNARLACRAQTPESCKSHAQSGDRYQNDDSVREDAQFYILFSQLN